MNHNMELDLETPQIRCANIITMEKSTCSGAEKESKLTDCVKRRERALIADCSLLIKELTLVVASLWSFSYNFLFTLNTTE